MKWKDVKKVVDKMTIEELNQSFIYNSPEMYGSGVVDKIRKASTNLYYTGDDDPAELYTKSQLLEEGYDKQDIEEMEIEVPKGNYYIEF